MISKSSEKIKELILFYIHDQENDFDKINAIEKSLNIEQNISEEINEIFLEIWVILNETNVWKTKYYSLTKVKKTLKTFVMKKCIIDAKMIKRHREIYVKTIKKKWEKKNKKLSLWKIKKEFFV